MRSYCTTRSLRLLVTGRGNKHVFVFVIFRRLKGYDRPQAILLLIDSFTLSFFVSSYLGEINLQGRNTRFLLSSKSSSRSGKSATTLTE